MSSEEVLPGMQEAIPAIAAAAATGEMAGLSAALMRGLDAGLTISEVTEIFVQLYAYTGFPRSLNALDALMKLLEARRQQGLHDAPGRGAGPVPSGDELLALGTANQTALAGAPVHRPVFEFAPVIDRFLKTHVFGDIFGRDNLDWRSRELATVSALAALAGAEAQLLSHVRISMNIGLDATQLRRAAGLLAQSGYIDAAERAHTAIAQASGSVGPCHIQEPST